MSIPVLKTGCDFIPPTSVPQEPKPSAPKLLDRLRLALETRRYRPETVGRFIEWNRQLILYHAKRHPETMGREEIEAFLGHLAQLGYGVELQAEKGTSYIRPLIHPKCTMSPFPACENVEARKTRTAAPVSFSRWLAAA